MRSTQQKHLRAGRVLGSPRTWLLVGLLTASPVLANPVVAKPARPTSPTSGAGATPEDRPVGEASIPPQIPAGGVLPIYNPCNYEPSCPELEEVIVIDAVTGAPVAGHVENVTDELGGQRAYFVPDVPFVSGATLLVSSDLPQVFFGRMFAVEVVAGTSFSAASVTVEAGLSKHRVVLRNTCCAPLTFRSPPRCIAAAERVGVMLTLNTTPADVIATQYLFEFSSPLPNEEAMLATPSFRSLFDGQLFRSYFEYDGTEKSYCHTLRAIPVAGGDVVEVVTTCVENTLTDLGTKERTEAELERWLLTCEMEPVDTDEADANVSDAAARAPDAGRDGGIEQSDDAGTPDASGQSDGCHLATSPTAGASVGWLVGLVLWTRRRRPWLGA